MQEDLKAKRATYLAKAKAILAAIEKKPSQEKRKKLEDAEIPGPIIRELVPDEKDKKK